MPTSTHHSTVDALADNNVINQCNDCYLYQWLAGTAQLGIAKLCSTRIIETAQECHIYSKILHNYYAQIFNISKNIFSDICVVGWLNKV